MSDQNLFDRVEDAIVGYNAYLKDNSKDSNEIIKVKIDKNKKSTISYVGPAGSFTVKADHETKTATAKVHFVTGHFKAQVTEDSCNASGDSPVFHKHWGHFHAAFEKN